MFTDIVIVLGVCVIFGLIAKRLGQNVLVGYLLAGVVLGGPGSLGIIGDIGSFSFMGELGIALLLFTVGLDLPLDKVRKFGLTALVAGGLQVVLTCALTTGISIACGLSPSAAFVVGIAVAMSSTAVVIRLLADRSEQDSVHGLVATGMLIAQDVVVVLVLVLIPLLPGATGADTGGSFTVGLAEAVGKLLLLVAGVVFIERVVMRRLFERLAIARELLAVASFTVSLGAIGACWALDLSPVLGGFVAGIVMADASYASQVRSEIAPIRMGLVAVFFAYVGMLADASWMAENALFILAVVVPLLVGKAAITWVAARMARVPAAAAILTAAALCQLGEFSFAVLTAGDAHGLVSGTTFRLLVSVSLVTLLVTPGVLGVTSRRVQAKTLRSGEGLNLDDGPVEQAVGDHAIIVGVGPSGRAVAAALAGAGVPIVVVELNVRSDTGDEEDGLPLGTRVVFGDAGRPEILARAGIASARIIVVTIPDPVAIRTVISQVSQLAPDVPIVARGRYNRFVPELMAAGADDVVDEEQVTGHELAEVALKRLVLEGAVERRREERRATAANTLATDQVDAAGADPAV